MRLTSSAFVDGGNIPGRYTCDGSNVNPPLEISGIPAGSKSLALIVDDPDAPSSLWVHWTVWNIPPDTTMMYEGSTPKGVQGVTSFGKAGYGGPCPPSGTHHYIFKLCALDTELDVPYQSSAAELERKMAGHVLAKAQLIGLYSRNKK